MRLLVLNIPVSLGQLPSVSPCARQSLQYAALISLASFEYTSPFLSRLLGISWLPSLGFSLS